MKTTASHAAQEPRKAQMEAELGHLAFFGFTSNPFPVTPVQELFFTSTVQQIIDECLHGVFARKGFMVICGEIGLGKTTISRKILEGLHEHGVRTALILHPFPDPLELIRSIARDFGITCPDNAHLASQIDCLNHFLLEQNSQGANCAILVDEAQNLSLECLELIRMISNLETGNRKLVQILLIGQPELDAKLSQHELRQLRSRIVIFRHVHALDREELGEYIESRFAAAGGGTLCLKGSALSGIHAHTKGNFRRLNLLMDRILYAAFAEGKQVITPHLVRLAAADLCFQEKRQRWNLPNFIKLSTMLAMGMATGAAAFLFMRSSGILYPIGEPERVRDAIETSVALIQPSASAPEPTQDLSKAEAPSPVQKQTQDPEVPLLQFQPTISAIPSPINVNAEAEVLLPVKESSGTNGEPREQVVSTEVRSFLTSYHLENFAQEFQKALYAASLPELADRIQHETGLQLVGFTGKLPQQAEIFDVLGVGGTTSGNSSETYYLFWKPPYIIKQNQAETTNNMQQVKARLIEANFLVSSVDDVTSDQKMTKAILAFQQEKGIPDTGIPDAATVFMLEHLSMRPKDHSIHQKPLPAQGGGFVSPVGPDKSTVAEVH